MNAIRRVNDHIVLGPGWVVMRTETSVLRSMSISASALDLGTDSIRSTVPDAVADEPLMGRAVIAAERPNEKRRSVIA
ncbi:hypothetical protein BE15_43435 [Sorangium cellulosum]|uniref:Uncharacterized protein n=1 Tax=Sorangium cellulosum TaxID=56 RepID=A0A150QPY2_SORCE|nr:hypothetical protein BE15_43435 [Sorangium cellulosum]